MLNELSSRLTFAIPAWLDRAIQWWLAELRGLLSPRLLNTLAVPRHEHIIEFDGNVLRVWDSVSGSLRLLPDEDSQQRYLRETYGAGSLIRLLQKPNLRLRLAHDKCLIRELTVPLTSRIQARQMAQLQGRLSLPFEPNQVVCGHAIADLKDGSMKLTSIIVKRDMLERHVEVFARAGCMPDIIDARDADGNGYDVDLLQTRNSRGIAAFAIPLLLIGALLLALVALHAEWSKRMDALAELDLEISNVKAKVDSLLKKSSEINAVADAVTSLRRKRVLEPPAVELWDQLARTVPDSAWISQLQATKSKLSVSGFATEAAPLVGILEREPLFKDVVFTSPVSFDPGAGAERFAIGLTLEFAGPAEPSGREKASN